MSTFLYVMNIMNHKNINHVNIKSFKKVLKTVVLMIKIIITYTKLKITIEYKVNCLCLKKLIN